MLPPGRIKVLGWIKQGGGPDSAHEPCHLWAIGFKCLMLQAVITWCDDDDDD